MTIIQSPEQAEPNPPLTRQAVVAELGDFALRQPSVRDLFAVAVQRVAVTLDVPLAHLLLWEPESGQFKVEAGVGWEDGAGAPVEIPGGGGSQAGYTLTSEAPVIVERLAAETRFSASALLEEHGVVSGLSVLIGTVPEPVGVLAVHTRSARTFSDEDAHFLRSVATLLGVAHRRRDAERKLVHSETRFRRLLESASVAILLVRGDGQIAMANRLAEQIFGYPDGELLDRPVEMLLPDALRQRHRAHRDGYHADPRVRAMGQGLDLVGQRRDGTIFPIEVGLSSIRQEEDLLVMAFVTDISQRKASEARLLHYSHRLEGLREIDRSILAARASDEIAGGVLSHLERLTPSRGGALLLVDPDGESLTVHASTGSLPAPFQEGARLEPDTLPMADGVRSGTGTVQQDVGSDGERLIVPLAAGDETLGMLLLWSRAGEQYDEEALSVVREVADLIAVAMQQAQLRDQLHQHAAALEERVIERTREIERRREVADGLRDILSILNTNRPLGELLHHIVRQSRGLLGVQGVAIYLQEAGETPVAVDSAPLGPRLEVEALQQGAQAGRAAMDAGRPLTPAAPAEGIAPIAALPVVVRGESDGALVLFDVIQRELDEEEVALAAALGDQAALAIENARLQERVERSAVVAERTRLARDLHDAVTQTLFSTSLLAEVLPQIWERDPEAGRERLGELRELTRGAMAEMRTLLLELRPATLTEVGLDELIRQLTDALVGRARIPTRVKVVEGEPLPPDVQLALYRIVQESLNNISKHAAPTLVTLELARPEGAVRIVIADDGRGFDPAKRAARSLGLTIMQERADAIGARLEIESEVGRGTRLSVLWPAPPGNDPTPSDDGEES